MTGGAFSGAKPPINSRLKIVKLSGESHRLFLTAWISISLLAGSLHAASSAGKRASDYGVPQVRQINQEIRRVWADYELRPSPRCDDGQWCRRVYLDVLGRIPSVAEVKEFTSNRRATKRADLVDRLLSAEEYQDQYARNWSTIWTNVLIGRSGGSERNSLTSREGMQQYLRDSLLAGKRYDQMVYELVTATGTTTPGSDGFNGAANYLAMKVNDEDGTLATASTARIFMGLEVQCTQCHNHPFNNWKQQKFWEFNAFFRQTRALRRFQEGTRNIAFAELVDEDFGGQARESNPENAAIYYELRNGLLKVAYPVFVDGTEIGTSGLVQQTNRRQELGRLILASEYMDKMLVNRYWAHFMGYGFTKPIDDMGPHNAASHPQLLEYLSEEIRDAEYDLKKLIRWIVLSEAYSLSSRMNRANEGDDPTLGDTPKFSHFYLRQMRAEELYESLLVATKAEQTRENEQERARTKAAWLSQFVTAFGNDEGEESTTFNGTIPQALVLFNGELIRNATAGKPGSRLGEIASRNLRPKEAIQLLFLAGLSRNPTAREVDIANRLWVARAQDQYSGNGRQRSVTPPALAALQDLWWAILNSNEFIMNH